MNTNRVLRTLSAHGYGQAITVMSTIAIPSVAVAKWGAVGFGYWVSLSALAQFFMLSDLGASLALANQLCLKSNRTANDAWLLIRAVCRNFTQKISLATAAIGIISLMVWLYYARVTANAGAAELAIAFALIALSAALQPAIGVYCAIWRYNGHNEVGIFIANTVRFIEFISIVSVALIGGGIGIVACAAFVTKLISVAIMVYHTPRLVMASGSIAYFNRGLNSCEELIPLQKAGYGFMLISLSQQVTLHGPVLLISALLGPIQAAVFSAARTISRLPLQPLTVFMASLNPELTELASHKQYNKLRIVVHKVAFISIGVSFVIGVLVVFYVDFIEKIWLANKLILELNVLVPLSLAASFCVGGQVLNQALSAVNETRVQSRQYVITSTLLIVMMLILIMSTKKMMSGALLVLLSEGLMAVLLYKRYNLFVRQKINC